MLACQFEVELLDGGLSSALSTTEPRRELALDEAA